MGHLRRDPGRNLRPCLPCDLAWMAVVHPCGNVQGVLSVTNVCAGPHTAACRPGSVRGCPDVPAGCTPFYFKRGKCDFLSVGPVYLIAVGTFSRTRTAPFHVFRARISVHKPT